MGHSNGFCLYSVKPYLFYDEDLNKRIVYLVESAFSNEFKQSIKLFCNIIYFNLTNKTCVDCTGLFCALIEYSWKWEIDGQKMAAEDKIPNFLKDFIDWNIFDPDLDCTKAAENY